MPPKKNSPIASAAALLGRKGGSANTPEQNAARARNGALGGRPAAWERQFWARNAEVLLAVDHRREQGETSRLETWLHLREQGYREVVTAVKVKESLAAKRAAPDPRLGVITDWPSETFMGSVELAGSRDRWVCAVGVGGHKDFLRGGHARADEAQAALVEELARRQARIRAIYAQRLGEYASRVQCVFPATQIEIVGDPAFVAPTLRNRVVRRAHLQKP
jgi:hypothetical protein